MCTILVMHQRHPRYPLVVAANRDEFYARGATDPALLADDPRVVGGRDVAGGGTWMGATEHGLFVGLTNQRTFQPSAPGRRSRGEVVLDALRAGSVARIERYLRRLDAREFNPFNLIFGDARELRVAYARGDAPRVAVEPVPTGLHVLPNDVLGSPEFPKVERARALAAPALELSEWAALAPALSAVLADHALPPAERVPRPPPGSPMTPELAHQLQALCIHTPVYGTRSSTLMALEPGRVAHYLFAPGAPCRTPFTDVTGLLAPPR